MKQERASKKQQELLSFVDGFIKGNGYGPSYREIMRALGYKSVSTVAIHVDHLITKGYLRRKDNSARSLDVVTLQPGGAAPALALEAQLLTHVEAKKLTRKEKQSVKDAMKTLGFLRVAAALDAQPEEIADVESN